MGNPSESLPTKATELIDFIGRSTLHGPLPSKTATRVFTAAVELTHYANQSRKVVEDLRKMLDGVESPLGSDRLVLGPNVDAGDVATTLVTLDLLSDMLKRL